MKNVISNQWDPGKGNYYLRQPDNDGRKCYDIRYTFNNIDFRGTLREQPYGARYAYRAEITAISPLTGKVVTDSKGNVVVRSFWSNEVDLNRLLNAIAKAAEKLYADNAVALSRAVEKNAVFRPETTTPAIAAERFAARYEDSLSAKAEKAERACPKYHRKAAIIKEVFASLCARLNPWKSVASSHHGDYRSAITSSFATFGIGALKTNTAPEPIRFRR